MAQRNAKFAFLEKLLIGAKPVLTAAAAAVAASAVGESDEPETDEMTGGGSGGGSGSGGGGVSVLTPIVLGTILDVLTATLDAAPEPNTFVATHAAEIALLLDPCLLFLSDVVESPTSSGASSVTGTAGTTGSVSSATATGASATPATGNNGSNSAAAAVVNLFKSF